MKVESTIVESPLLARFIRFCLVGVPVTASYAVTAYAGIAWLGLPMLAANLLGCAASIIVSYLGQKYFTFRSLGEHQVELPKFLVLCVVAICASSICMAVIANTGVDYRIALVVSAGAIAVVNFTVMNIWVFAQARHASPAE